MTALAPSHHIALLIGGWSAEREVSLASGQEIQKVLTADGFQVTTIDVTRDAVKLCQMITEANPDVLFNGLHGTGGEDGMIQGILEYLQIPYTHSGVFCSALSMNKSATKALLRTIGIQSPDSKVTSLSDLIGQEDLLPRPYILKPTAEGSSVGLAHITEESNLSKVCQTLAADTAQNPALTQAHSWMVEQYIGGIELTVGVLDGKALTVTEIDYQTDMFDYKAKYSEGFAQHILPARIPEDIFDLACTWAEQAHQFLGCHGISRCDFRYDPAQKQGCPLYFLEINTQPGFTKMSLLPEQAAFMGINYQSLCRRLIESATFLGQNKEK